MKPKCLIHGDNCPGDDGGFFIDGNHPDDMFSLGDLPMEKPCANGHVWTNQFGDDWTPEVGTPCDCGQKKWGVPITQAREHEWEFYFNGSFCKRCGAALGSGQPCR